MTAPLVRIAEPSDADAIAGIHVRSWQAAYRGLIDQSFLDALSIADRAERWRAIFANHDADSLSTLVAEREGTILGWTSFGTSRDSDRDSDAESDSDSESDRGLDAADPAPPEPAAPIGEIAGIYADPASWSTGVGHALLAAAERQLSADGHAHAHLWVLDGNDRADDFYARHGWVADGATRIEERPGLTLAEHRRIKRLE